MFKIDNLLLERDETRKFCIEIESMLSKFALPDGLKQKIILLLYEKSCMLGNISDLKEINFKLRTLNIRIYECLRIARHELKKDNKNMRNFVKEPIFQSYFYKDHARNIHNFQKSTVNFIKKYYLALAMLIGAIPFVLYFIVNKNIGSFPALDTLNILSLFGTIAISGAGLLFILYLFPILPIIWIYSSQDIKQDYKHMCPKEIPLVSIAFYLITACYFLINEHKPEFIKNILASELLPIYFFIGFIVLVIARFAITDTSFGKIRDDFKDRFSVLVFIFFNEFFWSFMPTVLLLILYVRVGNNSILILWFMILSMVAVVILIKTKDFDFYKLSFCLLIIANFTILFLASDSIIRISSYGNIDYKMLSLKKDALNALPKSVCQNNQNGCIGAGAKDGCYAKQKAQIVSYNKQKAELAVKDGNETYIFSGVNDEIKFIDANGADIGVASSDEVVFENSVLTYGKNGTRSCPLKASAINLSPVCKTYALKQDDDSVKLYNVKVLSALGKFYYLQTKSGEKFELDSSLIISKQKAGDTR